MDYPIHAAARLFPSLAEPELARLVEDIRRFGLRKAIVLYEGAILDGRARLEACRRAGVPPRYSEWEGEGSPLEWLVSENVGRRHLGPSQRALIALGMIPLLEAEARQARRARRGRPKIGMQQCALFSKSGKRRARRLSEAAAQLVGVSPRYVQVARRMARVFPDLLPSIAAGKINLTDAQRAARLDDFRRRRLLRALREKTASGEDLDVRRMLRQTHDPTPPRIVRIWPADDLPSPPTGSVEEAKEKPALTFTLTHRQFASLQRGTPVPVLIGPSEFLLVCREAYEARGS